MGERFESFDKMPTAEVFSNQELEEESFLNLSQTVEGLCSIESEEALTEFAMTRDNKEDIFYIFKFISSSEIFREIYSKDPNSFSNLNEKDYTEVINLAKVMQKILIIPPVFWKIGDLKANKESVFIAYINHDSQELYNQGLYMAFKNVEDEKRIFDVLLEKTKTSGKNYPSKLRSSGDFDITSISEDKINVRFSGNAGKSQDNDMSRYSPGVLRNFKQDLEVIFEEYFPGKEVEVEIQ